MIKTIHVTIIAIFYLLLLACIPGLSLAATHSPLDAFPLAEQGQVRHVILLDEFLRAEEGNFKVELIPGLRVKTDGVNVFHVGLFLNPVSLRGWGYTYYQVGGKGLVSSTKMAVPTGDATVESLVFGGSLMIRYNSRLPIVIYSPKGVEVHYRIWSVGKELKVAKEG